MYTFLSAKSRAATPPAVCLASSASAFAACDQRTTLGYIDM